MQAGALGMKGRSSFVDKHDQLGTAAVALPVLHHLSVVQLAAAKGQERPTAPAPARVQSVTAARALQAQWGAEAAAEAVQVAVAAAAAALLYCGGCGGGTGWQSDGRLVAVARF